ncbi:MAG: 7-carboxy-7-deazaguanine synthase QueE [Planctomycetota bacterium]
MSSLTAPVFEIFSGIQGEGVLMGVRQAFVRLCGCNRRCRFCDTREACEAPPDACHVEETPGARRFLRRSNPLTAEEALSAIEALEAPRGLHHSVSLTGGEPLLHPDFIAALASGLRARGLAVYLETNGTLPDALEGVVETVDYVAMDAKLASATGQPTPWDEHEAFLRLAARVTAQVKVVVCAATTPAELDRLAALVAAVAVETPLVLQPVTAMEDVLPPSPLQVLAMQARLGERLPDVRVIPQVHRLMQQR